LIKMDLWRNKSDEGFIPEYRKRNTNPLYCLVMRQVRDRRIGFQPVQTGWKPILRIKGAVTGR
jgi:hypothetical protein